MVNEPVEIKFTETGDGFRIDVKGRDIKDACACCIPVFGGGDKDPKGCCSTDKKEDE